jgi:hypothetical protein
MTVPQLRRELKKWQAVLSLQNWRIQIKRGREVSGAPVPFSDEINEECVGLTWWMPESPNAVVVIRKGQGVHTLVHELLHLRLEGHKETPLKYDPNYERALNHLTDCLVGKPDLTV